MQIVDIVKEIINFFFSNGNFEKCLYGFIIKKNKNFKKKKNIVTIFNKKFKKFIINLKFLNK